MKHEQNFSRFSRTSSSCTLRSRSYFMLVRSSEFSLFNSTLLCMSSYFAISFRAAEACITAFWWLEASSEAQTLITLFI